VTLQVAIERDLARPPRQIRRESLAKEGLCCGDAAIRPQEKIHRLAVLVDGPMTKTRLLTASYTTASLSSAAGSVFSTLNVFRSNTTTDLPPRLPA
jgi:hypothetical protein